MGETDQPDPKDRAPSGWLGKDCYNPNNLSDRLLQALNGLEQRLRAEEKDRLRIMQDNIEGRLFLLDRINETERPNSLERRQGLFPPLGRKRILPGGHVMRVVDLTNEDDMTISTGGFPPVRVLEPAADFVDQCYWARGIIERITGTTIWSRTVSEKDLIKFINHHEGYPLISPIIAEYLPSDLMAELRSHKKQIIENLHYVPPHR